ncbi:MAG: flavodoxin-dependent (E)-4-hydroxy-3-methylbut-2-enyl-diphosphate synthase [Ruminococcus sp.]|jgi:(E)-4-hydroxy-3-methylbut-2-enyl-diphosphate synthase|nr:flavodoxin-dependent (E)-4-hydroxy-3-methylbut-2-enyl-diphosphate synthase [Ruminococcus sp.]
MLNFKNSPVTVQSMLNVIASDVDGNIKQALALEAAGCDILRVAVPALKDTKLIPALKSVLKIPLVADIHFSAHIAVKCAELGVDKIRINPGNIGDKTAVKRVADACKTAAIPIRIGVNSGSVPKDSLLKYGGATSDALVEAALLNVSQLEECNFRDIVISVKSSNVKTMIEANRKLFKMADYPLHLGVTEAGTYNIGLIKSACGIGSLLTDGIGNTIRVSLTDDPLREVEAGIDILKALGQRGGINLISCPTCGRTQIDIVKIANEIEAAVKDIPKNLTVAVMGCVVNGPGEASNADLGIAGGKGFAVLFKKGQEVRRIDEKDIVNEILNEISLM